MSRPDVKFYEVGQNYGSWSLTTDRIEARSEWAILHDYDDERWDAWVNGRCMGRYRTEHEADAAMRGYLSGEMDGGVAIRAWEERRK